MQATPFATITPQVGLAPRLSPEDANTRSRPGERASHLAYETATIATMVVGLALPARAAVSAIRGEWADRYGDARAGNIISAVGLFVAALGV
jgi:hypothetical protein